MTQHISVRVLLFGHLRDSVPQGAEGGAFPVELPVGATVADLADVLARRSVGLANLLVKTRVAVGAEFADGGTHLNDNDEVAFLPPMSGG